MPALYAGADQQRWRELVAHTHVIDAVTAWLGNSPWRAKVPIQRCTVPSFDFLLVQSLPAVSDGFPMSAPFDGLAPDTSDLDLFSELVANGAFFPPDGVYSDRCVTI
jgi:hypothetical protein